MATRAALVNPYIYALQTPLTLWDPDGHAPRGAQIAMQYLEAHNLYGFSMTPNDKGGFSATTGGITVVFNPPGSDLNGSRAFPRE